jgi:RHS repeat-associated protein
MAFVNPIRFSSKFTDDEDGFLYYGFRLYNASNGRWLSRDPFQEGGFRRSYPAASFNRKRRMTQEPRTAGAPFLFCRNAPVNTADFLGLCVPGDVNADCVTRVVPSGLSVDTSQTLAELGTLADATEWFGVAYEAGTSAFTSLEEAVAAGVGGAANTGSVSFGGALDKAADALLQAVGDHTGWSAWIRVEAAICQKKCFLNPGRYLGDSGYWEPLPSATWVRVTNGDLLGGDFSDAKSALRAGARTCQKSLKNWKEMNGKM